MTTFMRWKDPITEEVRKKAEKELGETPEVIKKSLEELYRLINNEDGFLPVMEEWFLLIFLRNKKFNVVKTFKTLKKFYEFKSMYSGTISDLKPTHFKRIYDMDVMVISPLRNKTGAAVMTIFLDKFDLDTASPYDLFAAAFTAAEIAILKEVTQVCGVDMIFDSKGITLMKLLRITKPSLITMMVKCFQDRWPYRMNSFHIVNQPSYSNKIFELIKLMFPRKLRERFFIHGDNLNSLHSFIPPEVLPNELGGHLSDEIFQEFYNLLYENEPVFDILKKYTYNGISYGETDAGSNVS